MQREESHNCYTLISESLMQVMCVQSGAWLLSKSYPAILWHIICIHVHLNTATWALCKIFPLATPLSEQASCLRVHVFIAIVPMKILSWCEFHALWQVIKFLYADTFGLSNWMYSTAISATELLGLTPRSAKLSMLFQVRVTLLNIKDNCQAP